MKKRQLIDALRILIGIFAVITFFVYGISYLYIRVSHPELTSYQIVLMVWRYLACLVATVFTLKFLTYIRSKI